MVRKVVAVVLSTGKQGRGVVNALVNLKSKDKYHILALTRNATSEKARNLLKYESSDSPNSVEVVTCNIHNKYDMLRVFKKRNVWGVFCATVVLFKEPKQEFNDAKACIDASMESNVKFFIFSSVFDADKAPENISVYHDKYLIEQYLETNCKTFTDGWMSLKVPGFMENLLEWNKPSNGYLHLPVADGNKKGVWISCQNIGDIVAAFFNRDIEIDDTHSYDCIGDILTPNEMCKILSKVSGSTVKYHKGILPLVVMDKLGVKFAVELMRLFRWYDTRDITHLKGKQCYRDLPQKMLTFEQWAEMHFKDKDLSESMIWKLVKYATISAIIFGVASYARSKL